MFANFGMLWNQFIHNNQIIVGPNNQISQAIMDYDNAPDVVFVAKILYQRCQFVL
jgi:hypothetical protein